MVAILPITWLHVFYLCLVIAVVLSMVYRRDTAMVCTWSILILGFGATGSFITAIRGLFYAFIYTCEQLLGLILVIAVVVAMAEIFQRSGVNETLIAPFRPLIRNRYVGFWTLGLTIFLFSLFFWPSPAIALVGALLLPAARRAGMTPLAVAIVFNLFGHGFALSGDYVIQGTPRLTAQAVRLPIDQVMSASLPLVVVMGLVTTGVAYWLLHRSHKEEGIISYHPVEQITFVTPMKKSWRVLFAVLVAVFFVFDIGMMMLYNVQAEEATALIMGTSLLLLSICHLLHNPRHALKQTTEHLISGSRFALRIFVPVIPIASFFYLGGQLFFQLYGRVLPAGSKGLIYDWGVLLTQAGSMLPEVGVLVITGMGIISGLDGSGYAGISLIGQLSHLFATSSAETAILSAWGQIVSIWIGGGTIVPWALLPAAAICGVDPLTVAKRNLLPVAIGFAVTAVFVVIWLHLL